MSLRQDRGCGGGGSEGSGRKTGADREPEVICRMFQRGTCQYGSFCKYSHDIPSATQGQTTTDAPRDEHYVECKTLLRGRSTGFQGRNYLHDNAANLWATAVLVLDGPDRELHQFLARDLVSDEFKSFEYIKATMDMNGASENNIPCARSFLTVITHPSLLDPLSIDSFVGTLYQFFAGRNGGKALKFLLDLCQSLKMYYEKLDRPSTVTTPLMLIQMALAELLNREARSRFNDDVVKLFDKLDALAAIMKPHPIMNEITTRVGLLRRMVARETDRLATAKVGGVTATSTTGLVSSTFPTHISLPGGRHDNDFSDISAIQILPTRGEIDSTLPECLPSTDFTRPHYLKDPGQRHLDCAFRLLRHDIFGPLKNVLSDLLGQDVSSGQKPRLSPDASAHLYLDAKFGDVSAVRGGLGAVVHFQSPRHLRYKPAKERRTWWEDSSRLGEGSLVAYISSGGDGKALLLLEVTVKNTQGHKWDEAFPNVVGNGILASIGVKLATLSYDTVNILTKLHAEKASGVLVEFHGLIPATFTPVLSNLQTMLRSGDLAFRRWIVPTDEVDQLHAGIPSPAYTRRPNFEFKLDPIVEGGVLSCSKSRKEVLRMIEKGTILDTGQCEALYAALTQECALIQGPPGTGKSYVGVQLVRVLLENRVSARLGPILIICYTNHALDQFLEHLLAVDIQSMIRVGGRSQSKALEGKNLRVVRASTDKTMLERHLIGKTYSMLGESEDSADKTLQKLRQMDGAPTWEALKDFLLSEGNCIYRQMKPVDDDGFEVAGGDRLSVWLGDRPMNADERIEALKSPKSLVQLTRKAKGDISELEIEERWALAESWLSRMREEQIDRLFERLQQGKEHQKTIDKLHDEINRRTLLKAHVIGLTTTGLARNIATLRRLYSKVVICEEAAEVMEPHLLSALVPGVQHFIQIGDHRQLRPQIMNHSLSMETLSGMTWQLDRSQFERRAMGEPGMAAAPVAQLGIQRRMRPEISRLIRTVYPNLRDHDSVMDLPNVVGMRHNLFWLDHHHLEASRDDGIRVKSYSNDWEVEMASALVRHLVRQGAYATSDIALLTPYTGQLRKLRATLSKDFEVFLGERDEEALAFDDEGDGRRNATKDKGKGKEYYKAIEKKDLIDTLRLATVDNFQGEEAKVIIVSLVRSNKDRKIGFLRTENRINVLLSRAKHGMYLIGNTETYLTVEMWADVHAQLSQSGAVGDAIPLCCPRHPETPILCAEPSDFLLKSPDGGCDLPCSERLEPCGHRCRARCHSQVLHDAFLCPSECARIRPTCGHSCRKFCGDACGPCPVVVRNFELPCRHKATLECHKMLDLAGVKCAAKVDKVVPECGHTVSVECSEDVISDSFSCPAACGEDLECGHQCPGQCGTCKKKGHPECSKVCGRAYGACSHRCPKPCHPGKDCGACEKPCEVRCPHSRCALRCSKPCSPCIEPCDWSCPHQGSCTMPCAAPCNRLPCDERCELTLACGHQCLSFCGEACPDRKFCQVCRGMGSERVDFTEMKEYADVDLDETPIVVLTCGHFYTGENLDMLVELGDVYAVDGKGKYTGLKGISAALAKNVPVCPDCRLPIRQFSTRRYNRVVNKAVVDETSKRFLASGERSLKELEERLKELEKHLALGRSNTDGKDRYAKANKLQAAATFLIAKMESEHRSTKKLHDAILTRNRQQEAGSVTAQMQAVSISGADTIARPTLNNQVALKARMIRLRTSEAVHRDELNRAQGAEVPPRIINSVATFLQRSIQLAADATEAKMPRVTVGAILSYAGLFHLRSRHDQAQAANDKGTLSPPWDREAVRERLGHAASLCDELPGGEELQKAVDAMKRVYEAARYGEVTPEEVEAIKVAMVSGGAGIATNSGHWYNCANGHPFVIGECGMPTELARCPECGARIGGTNHNPVEGTTRAREME